MFDDPEVDQQTARDLGVTTALYVPLIVRGHAIGVIAAHDKDGSDPRFSDEDVRLGESLAQRAAIAVDLSQRVSRDALRRVVDAQELERRRLARELHDETGQALTSILLGLKTLEDAIETDQARAGVASVRELVVSTLQDVRRLAVELRPSRARRLRSRAGSRASRADAPSKTRRSRSISRLGSATNAFRPTSRRRSTGSCRRRSRTSQSTLVQLESASC